MLYRFISEIIKFGTRILCRIDAPDLYKMPSHGPLIVYSNRELSSAIAFEGFKPVVRQCRQIGDARGRLEPVEAHLGLPGKARELLDMPSRGKPFGRLVPIADNHDGND